MTDLEKAHYEIFELKACIKDLLVSYADLKVLAKLPHKQREEAVEIWAKNLLKDKVTT